MTKISEYTEISIATADDLLIGTDVSTQNETKNFSIQQIINLAVPYKSYVCLLTQEGILNPVATVLYNDIGEVTWTRVQDGVYLANTVGLLTQDKTIGFCQVSNSNDTYQTIKYDYNYYGNGIILNQYSFAGIFQDSFNRSMIEIRVYS
jgi:hypothetical protein